MPRRQAQIAADKVVATQVFADSVNASSSFLTPSVDAFAIPASSNGATFLVNVATPYTLPASTELTAGWSIKFIVTVAAAFIVNINASEVDNATPANNRFYSIGPLELTNNADIPAGSVNHIITGTGSAPGEHITITWNGTTFDVSGLGLLATFIVFST